MKRSAFSLYYVLHYLPGLLLAGLLLHACGSARTVWADPLPELSARRFEKELVLMTAEYDKEVTQRQAESNPYLSERLILKSADPNLDPDEYGAVDAIQDRNGTYILQFESPGEARAAAHALSREDSTVYVEPDGYLFACGFSTVLDEALWGSSAKVIGADQYAQSLAGTTGTVEVAVLDTGISFTSPKLAGKLDTARAMSFATYEGDLLNVDQSQDSSTETKARHGTHVAGVIAQCTESLPNIRILPVRVLNNKGAGSVSQVANGIRYAADQGAAVINMSLSGKLPIGGATIREAIDYAVSRGTIVVGVSGNNGTDVSAYTPGNIEECVVVGAVNGNDSSYPRWSGSNYGSTVDIVAPGVNVYGTVWENLSDGYNSLTGTSMASPHAAAAAAMIKLAHGSYGPAEIEHVLQQSVIDLGESGKDKYYGHGMIDLNSLLGNDEVIQEEVADWQLQNMAAADAVTSMISALPDPLSLEDKNLVSQARSAYNALTYMQKRLVTNLSRLESAEASISKMEADYEAAQIVVERISDLSSEITLADKASVESARAAYESLTEDQKVYVTNLSVLTDAEEKIRKLEADIEAAQTVMERISDLPSEITLADKVTVESVRAAYEALSEDQKTLVTNMSVLISAEAKIIKLETDLAAAQAVMEQISNLPSEITLADRATVESARAAYDALSEDQKTLVTNLSVLISAEAKITKLETDLAAAQAVMEQISDLPLEITLADRATVESARAAYDALTGDQKALVTNLSVLTSAEAKIKQEADIEAAQAVMERISDLPSEITLADKASVESARAAYESLTEDQKVYVTNLSVLTDAEEKIRKLEADIEAAQAVMERISDLPSEITLADKVTVESVRAAYEALSEDQKTLVTNLSVLISAEAKIIKLETDLAAAQAVMEQISDLPSEITLADRATVESARAAYDALSEDQKTLVTNLSALISAEAKITKLETDLAAAQAVMEQISDLPSEITLADRATVESARAAYDALTGDQKALVTNLSVLTSAEAKIKQEADIEAAQAVMERISDLPSEITLADKAAVESVRAAYDALTGDQKALVTNLSVLTGAEAKIRQQEALKEQEEAASGEDESSEYKDSRPVANVTYRVPLKKKQKTKVLKVTGLADGDYVVKWTSSARKKVKVTGRADGTCVIKAGSRTGNASVTALTASGRKVVFKLRVQNGKVKTKKLKTSKKTIRIGVGESIKLPVTRYPVTSVQKITYTSKNKAAARVAGDGTVTGAAPGTARIVVRSGNAKLTFTVITG